MPQNKDENLTTIIHKLLYGCDTAKEITNNNYRNNNNKINEKSEVKQRMKKRENKKNLS